MKDKNRENLRFNETWSVTLARQKQVDCHRKPCVRIRGKMPRNANALFGFVMHAGSGATFFSSSFSFSSSFPPDRPLEDESKKCARQRDDFSHPRVHFTARSRGLLSDLLELVYTGSKTYLAFSCETLTTLRPLEPRSKNNSLSCARDSPRRLISRRKRAASNATYPEGK